MKTQEKQFEPGHPLISRTPGIVGGSPAIDGHRIRVSDVVRRARDYKTGVVEKIREDYPHIKPEQIEAALAYYDAFPDDVDAEIEEERALAASWIQSRPST